MKLLSTGLEFSMILGGVQDVLIFAIDTLNGFNEAIKAVYRWDTKMYSASEALWSLYLRMIQM